MSVNPVEFDGTNWLVYDENAGHSGLVPPEAFVLTNYQTIEVQCPECVNISWHPAGGGAAPLMVQELFARTYQLKGCPCGYLPPGQHLELCKGHARKHCLAQDGLERFKLNEVILV